MALFAKKFPVRVDAGDVYFDEAVVSSIPPAARATGLLCDEQPVWPFVSPTPHVRIHVGLVQVAHFRIEPIEADPDLVGKFFHSSIRVLDNLAVMMDGLISLNSDDPTAAAARGASGEPFVEGVRFPPLFIGAASQRNAEMIGKGLFIRGLHTSGTVTPGTVRACCMCDACGESFGLQHFHTGFGQGLGLGQYFYCERGIHTAIVDPDQLPGCPRPLQEEIDRVQLADAEARLPPCAACGTRFGYWNPLRCPHCAAPYIDFARFPEMRPFEYYGNVIVGQQSQHV